MSQVASGTCTDEPIALQEEITSLNVNLPCTARREGYKDLIVY
jgi:hypothetical protein